MTALTMAAMTNTDDSGDDGGNTGDEDGDNEALAPNTAAPGREDDA